jgi:hypothetical protein
VRVVIAEDLALLREGIVALLREHDIDVVAQAEDADDFLRVAGGHKPTSRSSTSGSRPASATRACAPRSRRAGGSPAWRC